MLEAVRLSRSRESLDYMGLALCETEFRGAVTVPRLELA